MRTYQPDVELRWHVADADADRPALKLYAERMRRANFNHATLTELQMLLREERRTHPGDQRIPEYLAQVILQDRVDVAGLDEARSLLAAATDDCERGRTLQVLSELDRNAAGNVRGWLPYRINWSVTNTCPMICKGCYNVFTHRSLGGAEAGAVAEKIISAGIGAVMISGGDPLFWDPLLDVVRTLHAAGVRIGLDTTGHPGLRTRFEDVLPYLDTIGLPLDSLDLSLAARFRRGAMDDVVRYVLDLLHHPGLPRARVHTVVTRWNVGELPLIQARLEELSGVTEWALYQFWPRRISSAQRDSIAVSDEAFVRAVSELQAERLEIFSYPFRQRAFMNAMVLASGELVTFGEQPGEEFLVGDVVTEDLAELFSRPAVRQGKLVRRLLAGSGEAASPDER